MKPYQLSSKELEEARRGEVTYQSFLAKYRLILTDEMLKDLAYMHVYDWSVGERSAYDSPRGEGG